MSNLAEVLEDFGPDPESPAGIATRWIKELGQSKKFQKDYLERCGKIIARYKDKKAQIVSGSVKRKFAVLWANIETLKPACYAKLPVPYVTRSFNDPDPVARVASEVLERAIKNCLENYDFDGMLKSLRDDFLLFARGVPWIRYEADFAPQQEAYAEGETPAEDAAEPAEHELAEGERLTDERAVCDHVCLEDFGTNTARTWSEVRFVWRRTYLTRAQLRARFTNKVNDTSDQTIGDVVPLDWKPDDKQTQDADRSETFAKAQVYEIWDKESRRAYWISESYPAGPLDVRDDPLGLKDFFPCPKPAYGTLAPDSVIPIPDYVYYQDQAEEVDDLTMRIGLLTSALRMVGLYAGDQKTELQQVFKVSSENQMIPVDSWAAFQDKGGIKGVIEWVPVDMVKDVLQGLFETRKLIMDDIYQITGISDIMRGDTVASETATAQQIKSTWGSSRVREKQKEIARCARDIMRIMGEIIAEKFGIDTLEKMTNFQLLRQAEKQQVVAWQQAVQQLQAQQQAMQGQMQPVANPMPGQPPQAPPMPQMQPPPPPFPEDKMRLMSQPTWEEVKSFLADQGKRMMRIDVEADSTIDADAQEQRQAATEYVTSMGALISQALPAVQAAPPLGLFLGSVIKAVGRLYPFGRQFEEELDQSIKAIGEMPPQPKEGEQPKQAGKSPEELAIEAQKVEVSRQQLAQDQEATVIEARTAQIQSMDKKETELAKLASNERIAQLEARLEQMAAMMEAQTRGHEAGTEARVRTYESDNDVAIRQVEAEQARRAAAAKPSNGSMA